MSLRVVRQCQPVYYAWHMYISEQDADIRSLTLQGRECVFGMASFYYFETGLDKHVDRHPTKHELVFGNNDNFRLWGHAARRRAAANCCVLTD